MNNVAWLVLVAMVFLVAVSEAAAVAVVWNGVLVPAFGWPSITFAEAAALTILMYMLVGLIRGQGK